MHSKRGFSMIFIIILTSFFVIAYFIFFRKPQKIIPAFIPTPTATPYQFPYKNPPIPKNQSYRIIIVGDSIVNSLGLNANILRERLIAYYPDSEFVTYNYGYSATNVLSLNTRLTETTKNGGEENVAVLKQGFELIIIESFGNNPLSELSLEEGLKKQNEELEKSVRAILAEKPNASLAFMTPIALDPVNYARSTRNLTPEVRRAWVAERVSYIDNHRKFAEEKGIPVIDVYKASLGPNGQVDSSYISDDFIHPSKKGVELISNTIAGYIFTNKIFPN